MVKRWIWPLITTAATVAYFLLPNLEQSVLYLVTSVAAGMVVLAVPGRTSDAKAGWRTVGVGWLLVATGNAIWFWYEFVALTAPFPSIADVAYLSGYMAFAVGLLLLARAIGRPDVGALLDAAVVAIGTGVLAWVTLVTPYANDGSLSLLVKLGSIAYPACDLLVLTLLLRLLFVGHTRRHPALMLLALSFTLTLVADIGFAWMSLQGTYASGHILDAGWLLGYMLVGTAALHPTAAVVTSPDDDTAISLLPKSRLVLLAAASLVAPVLVIYAGAQDAELDLVVAGTASAVLFLLVLWRMAGLVRQITMQAVELDALSTTDALTGLANRRSWDTELPKAVVRAQRYSQPLAVALLDIDHFKKYNDTHGHPAGDVLLASAAAAWLAHLRAGDLLARVGGEEFAVLLIGANESGALPAVERLRTATPEGTTCSAGIALLEPRDSPAELVARADVALYEAKTSGRNRTVVASDSTAVPTA